MSDEQTQQSIEEKARAIAKAVLARQDEFMVEDYDLDDERCGEYLSVDRLEAIFIEEITNTSMAKIMADLVLVHPDGTISRLSDVDMIDGQVRARRSDDVIKSRSPAPG